MSQFGDQLRQQRIARGISLSEIAAETRISARYLEALEKQDVKQLPGAVFARSFARQYAEAVGLDFAQIEAQVAATFPTEEQLPVVEAAPAARFEMKPIREILPVELSLWQRPLLMLVLALGASSLIYVGWQRFVLGVGSTQEIASEAVPPTKLAANPSEPLPAAPMVAASAPGGTNSIATPQGGTTSFELQAPPGSTAGISVRLIATQETWVSITANGKRLFRGVLQPNETRVLTGVEKAVMIIGNAGGVEVLTDGRSIGPIGPPGQVRVVQLSPEGTEIKRQYELANSASEGTSI
jgi:cytoskeletal protein RodZ